MLLYRLQGNQNMLNLKYEEAVNTFKLFNTTLVDVNTNFRKLDRDINTSRPELMQLQEEKKHLTE